MTADAFTGDSPGNGDPAVPCTEWSSFRRGDALCEERSWLRGQEPVAWVRTSTGDGVWLVSSYPSARQVLEDARFGPVGTAASLVPHGGAGLRGAVMRGLNPRADEESHSRLRDTADRLIDDLMAWGPPVDLRAGFADPFAAALRCKVLGVPSDDWPRLTSGLDIAFMASAHPFEGVRPDWYKDAGYMAERLNAPASERSGLLGQLAALREGPEPACPTDGTLAAVASSLFGAGAVSTSTFLVMAVLTLLRHPEPIGRLRGRPERTGRAVDELLRRNLSAADGVRRIALADVHLGDVLVRRGEPVVVLVEGADFGLGAFEAPRGLNPGRGRNPYLAFGGGRHLCPASALGRVHAETALAALVDRMPGLGLAVPAERLVWRTGFMRRLPERLPVLW
ncbi:cytochrome P450 [Streptomyces sp. Wb2n-11]|uniref:cytochrome P450 n=1 Tax=Streptomyces sp. Wb2n-11 TaxID=1030533 RepID=UPI000A53EA4A|nr:cytochrome P450 [Streptomyces sp. Wb2n-11]